MRLLLAALFVFGSILFVVALLGDRMEQISPLLLGPVLALLFLALCHLALVAFNSGVEKPQSSEDYAQQLQAWEELGLITTTEFHATRAFEVAEVEDEGRHLFLELQDGSVLYLTGQYLYGPYDDEHGQEPPPPFPCREFTLKRHQDGWVVDLICHGPPLDYETLEPAFWDSPTWVNRYPDDGDILIDRTYDELKNA
jgi:hypothetical protein